MNKVDEKAFLRKISKENRDVYQLWGVPVISSNSVAEFKIGKKYIYRLKNDQNLIGTHQALLRSFLNEIPLNNSAIAFRKNLSYLDFLEPHRNSFYFLRLDITSFFHSISEELISKSFTSYFVDEYFDALKTQKLVESFVNLVTYQVPLTSGNNKFKGKSILPMGFKTSPVISNIIFRKLDILIQKYCSAHKITYTRYADDMLFSSNKLTKYVHSERFHAEIKYLLGLDDFKLNDKKTIRSSHTISLNGYIVESCNEEGKLGNVRISNKKTKIIEKLLNEVKLNKTSQEIMTKLFDFSVSSKHFNFMPPKPEFVEKYCKDQLLNKMIGYRSYLISIFRFEQKYKCVDDKALLAPV